MSIKEATLAKDYEGKDALIVNFTFTNNSGENTSFIVATHAQAFQDGVALETAMIMDDLNYDVDASMKDIQSGASLSVQEAYVLSNTTSPVEVEVTELFAFGDEKLVKTFKFDQ